MRYGRRFADSAWRTTSSQRCSTLRRDGSSTHLLLASRRSRHAMVVGASHPADHHRSLSRRRRVLAHLGGGASSLVRSRSKPREFVRMARRPPRPASALGGELWDAIARRSLSGYRPPKGHMGMACVHERLAHDRSDDFQAPAPRNTAGGRRTRRTVRGGRPRGRAGSPRAGLLPSRGVLPKVLRRRGCGVLGVRSNVRLWPRPTGTCGRPTCAARSAACASALTLDSYFSGVDGT
jgi:hypothetical protein